MIEAADIHLHNKAKQRRSQSVRLPDVGSDPAGAAPTAYIIEQNEYPTLSDAQAKTVERAAVYAYCPRFASILPASTG